MPEDLRTRAVTLSSDRYRLTAKLDLVEVAEGVATPVDYKHGKPRETPQGLEAWPNDRLQLAVQCILLRENGYACEQGIIYYAATRQRVRVPFDDSVLEDTLTVAEQAWAVARGGVIPPPLEDSPKCPGCSLAPICLPGETLAARGWSSEEAGRQLSLFETGAAVRKPPGVEGSPVRQLVTPRSELRPAYLDTQGLRVGKSGEVLQVKEKDTLKQEIRMGEICQLNLMGNIQVSTQAVQSLCEHGVPICYFSQGGWFYGITTGMNTKNVFLRRAQYRLADEEWFCLRLAQAGSGQDPQPADDAFTQSHRAGRARSWGTENDANPGGGCRLSR
jgi:CRISPR-associated protein Cas1